MVKNNPVHVARKAFCLVFALITALVTLTSCQHESVEQQAEREAEEYTRRFCPTPVQNFSRTDSERYDPAFRVLLYICTFFDTFDNPEVVDRYRDRISTGLYNEIVNRPTMSKYVAADMQFIYIVRSDSNPDLVLYQDTIRAE